MATSTTTPTAAVTAGEGLDDGAGPGADGGYGGDAAHVSAALAATPPPPPSTSTPADAMPSAAAATAAVVDVVATTTHNKVEPVDIAVRNLRVSIPPSPASTLLSRGSSGRGRGRRDQSSLAAASTTTTRVLIDDISMAVPAGSLMAIMGGSGSGKTTLLNALAQRLSSGTGAAVSGQILFNNTSPARYVAACSVAFVNQTDELLPYLTVRDTLRYAAQLRLPRLMSVADKDAMVESVILELGLKECADTLVGDEWRKGISGGEKRRVSVGVQLLTNPSVIFMDEPTTGLDSFSARSLVETLTSLCVNGGRTIIISIHQPRSQIFNQFDRITLLARGGQLAYSGTRDGAIRFFERLGHPVPIGVNGADFLIDVVSVDNRSEEAEKESLARVAAIVAACKAATMIGEKDEPWSKEKKNIADEPSSKEEKKNMTAFSSDEVFVSARVAEVRNNRGASFTQQIRVLTSRVLSNMREDRLMLWGSIIEVVFLGLLMGAIFFRPDESPSGILSRKSALYSACALQNYLSLMFITFKLSSELRVFDRERADKMYSVPAYLISWWSINFFLYALVSTIFATLLYFMVGLRSDDLGYHYGIFVLNTFLMQLVTVALSYMCVAINRDFGVASLIANSLFTFISMSCGFFIPVNIIPVYLRWIQHVSYITYGLRVYATNEFSGRVYDCPGLPRGIYICRGESVIDSLGFESGLVVPFVGLAALFVGFTMAAGIILHVVERGKIRMAGKVVASNVEADRKGKDAVYADVEAGDTSNGRGLPTSVTVRLEDLDLCLVTRASSLFRRRVGDDAKKEVHILNKISAVFPPGQLTAILGASGAGKSTLLALLHARRPRPPPLTSVQISGSVTHNGRVLSDSMVGVVTASVRQDDSHLLPALTARETLRYAALMRLVGLPEKDRIRRAENVLMELGLKDCADTIVGGNGVKGLSGGEKRRLSVGLALLTDPHVLLLDEPTSGLDAASASNMMHLLKSLAEKGGRTVICTIHQPRSDTVKLMHRILLLARGGRVVYSGPGDQMVTYFQGLGHRLPPLTNPADFALDLSSVDLRSSSVEETSRARVNALVEAWAINSKGVESIPTTEQQHLESDNGLDDLAKTRRLQLPLHRSLPLLISRSFTNLRRQNNLIASRISQSFAFGVIVTLYFVNLGRRYDQASAVSRIGLLQQTGPLVFIGMLNCIAVFPQELGLFKYERQDRAYSVEAFFLTYLINELPFEILGGILFSTLLTFAIGLRINFFTSFFTGVALVNAGESIGLAFCAIISQPGFSVQLMSVFISMLNVAAGFLSVGMPELLTDINYVSLLRYNARVLAAQEFGADRGNETAYVAYDCQGLGVGECQFPNSGSVLELLHFDGSYDQMLVNAGIMVALVIVYRFLAYCVMKARL